MIRRPTLARLIESAIGELSMQLIGRAETHNISDKQDDIRKRLLLLQSMINAAPFTKRTSPAVIEKLQAILKSIEITCAPDFLVFLGRKYPQMMVDLTKDEVISKRIRHVYRIAEIGACFSMESLATLSSGITEVRRKVFEIAETNQES